MATSPTQRSLDYLKKQGALVSVAEHWNAFTRTRRDLFGFIDIVALIPGRGIVAVQTTSGSGVSARIKKILGVPVDDSPQAVARAEFIRLSAERWIESGGEIEVHGWRKVKVNRGGKATKWEVRIERLEFE